MTSIHINLTKANSGQTININGVDYKYTVQKKSQDGQTQELQGGELDKIAILAMKIAKSSLDSSFFKSAPTQALVDNVKVDFSFAGNNALKVVGVERNAAGKTMSDKREHHLDSGTQGLIKRAIISVSPESYGPLARTVTPLLQGRPCKMVEIETQIIMEDAPINTKLKRPGLDYALADQLLNMPKSKFWTKVSAQELRSGYYDFVQHNSEKFCEGKNFDDILLALRVIHRTNNKALIKIARKMNLERDLLKEILTQKKPIPDGDKLRLVQLHAEYVKAGGSYLGRSFLNAMTEALEIQVAIVDQTTRQTWFYSQDNKPFNPSSCAFLSVADNGHDRGYYSYDRQTPGLLDLNANPEEVVEHIPPPPLPPPPAGFLATIGRVFTKSFWTTVGDRLGSLSG